VVGLFSPHRVDWGADWAGMMSGCFVWLLGVVALGGVVQLGADAQLQSNGAGKAQELCSNGMKSVCDRRSHVNHQPSVLLDVPDGCGGAVGAKFELMHHLPVQFCAASRGWFVAVGLVFTRWDIGVWGVDEMR
jgi:hypothetical protein